MSDTENGARPPVPCDMHVHTVLSHDAEGSVGECCRAAVHLGVRTIGFAEHVDFDPTDPGFGFYDYARCAEAISAARREFGPELGVLHGVEVDYQKWFERDIEAFLAANDFDYVIGSVHAVDQQPVMSCNYVAGRSEDECYRKYFLAIRECTRSGLFDIVGHLEYAARRGAEAFGPYDPSRYGAEVDDVLTTVIQCGVCLEVNTSGLSHTQPISYPCAPTLRRYVELGGTRVCIGSDAHSPRDVGRGVLEVRAAVRSAGLDSIEVWRRRAPLTVPLAARASAMGDALP